MSKGFRILCDTPDAVPICKALRAKFGMAINSGGWSLQGNALGVYSSPDYQHGKLQFYADRREEVPNDSAYVWVTLEMFLKALGSEELL